MVQFIVGSELDRGTCGVPASSLGTVTTGPKGLLSWLESQLGLKFPSVSFTARMVAYLNCLREHDDGERFYSESLKKDEFGVAAKLLQWRDTWYEAGWSGSGFITSGPQRLLEMGIVEATAKTEVPPNLGQRVMRVSNALNDASLNVSLTLLDSPETFPHVWQSLFQQLEATTDLYRLEQQCTVDCDLAVLQRALISKRIPGKRIDLSGDGSVIVLRDSSPQLSSNWVARFAHEQLDQEKSVAVLASRHGSTLDDALHEAGYPRLGFSDTSFWRPAFQVLPLTLELIWKPLDPTVLLQFLTHAMGPIPGHIRRPLADIVSAQPGIGGDEWYRAVDKALDNAVINLEGAAALKKRKEEAEKIEFWLECKRFDPQTGVDISALRARIARVNTWLSNAFAVQGDNSVTTVYSAALGQIDDMLRTLDRLERSGTSTLTRESVRRLVAAVRGMGSSRPGRPWQCASNVPQLLRADTPATFLQPVANVIWWGCDDERLPTAYPWSQSEMADLSKNGVSLLPLETRLEWQAQSWLRPLLAATDRLVLVLHDNADSHHPIFDEILAIVKGWLEEHVDRLMRDKSLLPKSVRLPQTKVIEKQSAPAKQRWWQLPTDIKLPSRDKESFTSLEKFLYGPHQWLLNYQARIRPGVFAQLADGSQLKGALTHDLIEDFFSAHTEIAAINWNASASWANAKLRDLIEQKGAVLLTPGRQSEKEFFVGTAMRALRNLIEHLQSGNVVSVDMEPEFEGRFDGGNIGGSIDLVATNSSGEQAVVDIKWGGLDYRLNSLVESSYLQLAVYAQLAKQCLGKWPTLGYFIIRDARLLMLYSQYFPNATVVRPVNGESHLEFWQRVEATWKWRRAQIDRGLIEVPAAGTEPNEDSNPGELALDVPDTFDKFDDYTVLTGWSEDS